MLLLTDLYGLSKTALDAARLLARGQPATQASIREALSCSQATGSRALAALASQHLAEPRSGYEPTRPRGRPTVTWWATSLLMAWMPNEGTRRSSRVQVAVDDERAAHWIERRLQQPVTVTVGSGENARYLDGRLTGVSLTTGFSVVLETAGAKVRLTGELGPELELGTYDLAVAPALVGVRINSAPA